VTTDVPPAPPAIKVLRRTRVALWVAVAVAVPLAMLVGILATRDAAGTRAADSPLLSEPAPDITAQTIDGAQLRLSDLRGKWVLVNFFATWCVPCAEEHPDLVNFSTVHDQTGDAAVVGVVYSDSVKAVKDFRAERGGTWPMLTDSNGRIALDFGVSGIPESFLVSPDGIVVSKIIGGIQRAELETLLARAKGAAPS
jgi:cytochrome c biogenesis protein CcmG/thiol:disulfide interchange protein DsbE